MSIRPIPRDKKSSFVIPYTLILTGSAAQQHHRLFVTSSAESTRSTKPIKKHLKC